jgi:xanthine dehydrogenase small subunit
MSESPAFTLNGHRVMLDASHPAQSLLRWLNAKGMHGTKEGCGDGDCGACTVALLERDSDGQARWRAVNSCLLPLGCLPGREVLTVEALAEGDTLHPVQQALVDCAGSQCGYCTPGFVMSLFAAQQNAELGDACIEGNLCRCTGYRPIRAAMAQLRDAGFGTDRFGQHAARAQATLASAAVGSFFSPASVEEALDLKQRHPQAAWVAGATDLGVDLGRGKVVAPTFIALDRIGDLDALDVGDAKVRIGGGTSLSRIERELHGVFPMLDQMLHGFAARQVRNRATFGGNLGTASPIGDLLPVLLALDAVIELRGPGGTRRVAAADFFLDYRRSARAEDELVVAVELPRREDLHGGSLKVAKRQSDDISIVVACFALAFDSERRVAHARLAYGGVAAIPRRAVAVETYLLGRALDASTLQTARQMLEAEFEPLSDHRASAAYRRALCGSLFVKFVEGLQP